MKDKKHVLNNVWSNYPDAMSSIQSINTPIVNRLINEMFAVGDFYYYALNFMDSSLVGCHENILKIHGFKNFPQHLTEILDLIHPDDIAFVVAAENASMEKVKEIGFGHHVNLKSSYCFRMKTADGSYQLFHHQALGILKDERDSLVQAINIHTNINHFTKENNYIVAVTGVGGRNDFHQMHLMPIKPKNNPPENLTPRELEILHLIANGYSSTEISDLLILSRHTIRTHRKNILRKTNAKNASELVKKCIEWGYL